MPLIYDDLRGIARRQLRRQPPGYILQSGGVAHQAYFRLVHARGIHRQNRLHFFALCSPMIRRILLDRARQRRYAKRGGGQLEVPLDAILIGAKARGVEVEAFDRALKIDPRQCRVVE